MPAHDGGLTATIPFATLNPEAKRCIAKAASTMLDARWKAYQHTNDLYTMNPCPENWHRLKLAWAAYDVAFKCEHGTDPDSAP